MSMLRFVTGVVEESGWMDRPHVEYMDDSGAWRPVLTKAVPAAGDPAEVGRRTAVIPLSELEVY